MGRSRELPFEVRRLESIKEIEDDTCNRFHILTLIKGRDVEIRSKIDPERSIEIKFSETVIIPACFGKYVIASTGKEGCTVLKVLLKNEER